MRQKNSEPGLFKYTEFGKYTEMSSCNLGFKMLSFQGDDKPTEAAKTMLQWLKNKSIFPECPRQSPD